MSGELAGTNETSVFSVDPRAAEAFYLPDAGPSSGDTEPTYDVRGVDEISVLVDNGADNGVDLVVQAFAFNDEAGDGPVYTPVTDKESNDTKNVSAESTDVISIGVGSHAFLRLEATYSSAPTAGTLTVTYQGDRQG